LFRLPVLLLEYREDRLEILAIELYVRGPPVEVYQQLG
jgi:hypothetical protein